jgi:hypothetical protein
MLTIDHFQPRAKPGSDALENLMCEFRGRDLPQSIDSVAIEYLVDAND